MKKVLLPLALILASGSAIADQQGAYIGGNIGNASTNLSAHGHDKSFNLDDDVLAYGVYGGYNFTENLGLEATIGQTDEQEHVKKGYATLTPRIMFPLNDRFSVYGKAGIAYVAADANYNGHEDINRGDIDVDGFGWTAGAGVNFAVAEHLNVRAGVDYLTAELEDSHNDRSLNIDSDTTIYSVGVDYKF